MKRRAAAGILLILAIFIFYQTETAQGFQGIRTQAPQPGTGGNLYYYNERVNPFFPKLAPYYKTKGGYVTGNCTWYAWGRACEIAGKKLPHFFAGDAGTWWAQNKREQWYAWGSEPRRGAIVCYKTHVGIVERPKPLMISESGWSLGKKSDSIIFHCGTPWRGAEEIVGYIYVQD